MIHHHAAMPRHGQDGDAFDVIENDAGEINIWQGGFPEAGDYDTPEEAEAEADRLADEFDRRVVASMPPLPEREGEPIAARDVTEGDALDLYGDEYADPFRDPGRGLEYELAAVIDPTTFEANGSVVVIYTDTLNFACPADHIVYRKRI